jgi:hypothetical protein
MQQKYAERNAERCAERCAEHVEKYSASLKTVERVQMEASAYRSAFPPVAARWLDATEKLRLNFDFSETPATKA